MRLTDNKITVKNECMTCAIVLIGTVLISIGLRWLFHRLENNPGLTDWYYGFGFGSAAGFLFMVSFIIAGGLRNSFYILLERWKDFFKNLQISFGFALESFFSHIKDEGMVFWLYILVMVVQAVTAYYCLSNLANQFMGIM